MSLIRKTPYNQNISSKKLNEEINFQLDRGWSPVLTVFRDNERVLLKLTDWIGGEGDKPFEVVQDVFIGEFDFVTSTIDAVDIADGYISDVYLDRLVDADNIELSMGWDSLNPTRRNLVMSYLDHEGNWRVIEQAVLSNDTDLDNDTLFGTTREALKSILDALKAYLVIDDPRLTGRYSDRAPSQNSVWEYVENARARFDVPVMNLDTAGILDVENTTGVSPTNPYYIMVGDDNRTGGIHSAVCTEPLGDCCNTGGGYEEMGNRDGITGCLCTPEEPEVDSQCIVTIDTPGGAGSVWRFTVDPGTGSTTLLAYTEQIGDTVLDIAAGLAATLSGGCDGDNNMCTIAHIPPSDTFIMTALPGMGSTPNTWVKSVTNDATGTSTLVTVPGVDYGPPTYTGVAGHMIAYDGTRWYDFGGAVSGNSTTITNYGNLGIKYYIESTDVFVVPNYNQYIVHDQLIVDGSFTLDGDAELIIIQDNV